MRIWPTLAVAAALAALPGNALAAVSKPHFARSYRGTISGHAESSGGGMTVRSTWKISGVVFRRSGVGSFEGGWTGGYKVTAGKVSFTQTETGGCTFSVSAKFGLKHALPNPNPSVPFALDKDPLGRMTILGLLIVDRKFNVTETCPDPNGGPPTTNHRAVEAPTLFDPGETPWRPHHRLKRTRVERDGSHSKRTWSWNLRPVG